MLIDRSLAEAIAREAFERPYRQTKPVTTRKLTELLKMRGIHLTWESLHHLWSAGILNPIAVDIQAIELTPGLDHRRFALLKLDRHGETFVDLGISVDEEIPPLPAAFIAQVRDAVWWHPFQVWQFDLLTRQMAFVVSPESVLKGAESSASVTRRIVATVPKGIHSFAVDDHHRSFLSVLGLLIAIDPLVHVVMHNSHTYSHIHGETAEGYFEWIASQPGKDFLSTFGLNKDAIREWHRYFSALGESRGQFGPFGDLIRRARRAHREGLKVDQLLAQDYFDFAEMLRRYIRHFYDIELPYELTWRSSEPADSRPELRDVTAWLGLNHQEHVWWYLEGDTEEAYLQAWSEKLDINLRDAGIVVRNLGGKDNLLKLHLRIPELEYCQKEKIYASFAVDEDARSASDQAQSVLAPAIPEHLRQLRHFDSKGLLPIGFEVWKPDFVAANFTLEELALIATQIAQDASSEFVVTVGHIAAKLETVAKVEKALEQVLGELAGVDFSKGADWGRVLGNWAADHPRSGSDDREMTYLNEDERPITKSVVKLFRGRGTDYDGTAVLHQQELKKQQAAEAEEKKEATRGRLATRGPTQRSERSPIRQPGSTSEQTPP